MLAVIEMTDNTSIFYLEYFILTVKFPKKIWKSFHAEMICFSS